MTFKSWPIGSPDFGSFVTNQKVALFNRCGIECFSILKYVTIILDFLPWLSKIESSWFIGFVIDIQMRF